MKKITFFVLALLCTFITHAQIDTTRQDLANLFSTLNRSLVPTGYLSAWGTDMADRDDYDGQLTDSNSTNSMDMLRMLYADVFTARFATTASIMPDVETLNNNINNSTGNPVVLLFAQYAEFKPAAIQQGILSYTNGMLYENFTPAQTVPGGTNSAYTIKELFIAYPKQNMFTNTVAIKYNPSLYFSNTTYSVQSVQADFGAGYITIAPNTDISYNYTDSSGLHIIKFKASLSNGQVYITQMAVNVTVTNSGMAGRYALADLTNPDIDLPASLLHDGCRVYIRRSIATPANQILKPFIVVEGFDIHDAAPSLAENYQINSYIREMQDIAFQNMAFDEHLDDVANYDLIFIDWKNGAADITRNAAALEAVIIQINALKAASGSAELNVVMGVSMGGLISRYSLASMTKRNVPTGTRLLLTMDSPHQGAYVPLAFQHLVRGLQNVTFFGVRLGGVFSNTLDQANNLLSSAGAQQQLIMTATNASGTVAPNTFLNTVYRPMITFVAGDPQPQYDFRAVSNGSQCGENGMAVGGNLVSGSASANLNALGWAFNALIHLPVITKWKYKTEINAVGLTGNSQHQILHYL